MKIALIEVGSMNDESIYDRMLRVTQLVEEVEEVDLIVLPELWLSGAFAAETDYSKASLLANESMIRFIELAKTKKCWIIPGSFPSEIENGRYRNTAFVIDESGKTIADYSKIHLFGFDGGETLFFEGGNDIVSIDSQWGIIGLSICYDLRFPELFRNLVVKGVSIFLVISSWPKVRALHWDSLIRARAIENQAFVIGVNSIGSQSGIEMAGSSTVVSPNGVVVDPVLIVGPTKYFEIETNLVHELRQDFPVLNDLKISFNRSEG